MDTYDVIIIGCGGIGSAALYSATKAGLKTLCIEQYQKGHQNGGTHGETRMLRTLYYDSPQYIPLLQQAYFEWQRIEKTTNIKFLIANGILEIGPFMDRMSGAITIAEKYNIPIEKLSREQIHARFPGFHIPEEMTGLFQPQAGFLYLDNCLDYFIDTATSAGATILYNEKVLSWQVKGDQTIYTKTDKGDYQSQYLIITAGSWVTKILPELNIPLTIIQKKLLWINDIKKAYSVDNKTPCYAYHLPNGIFYGFPTISGYMKVARHTGGTVLHRPEDNFDIVDDEEIQSIKEFANQYLTNISLNKMKQANCLYDNTPDKEFIVDIHPQFPQVAFAAGLSGHGYKMSNVLGNILVDLVMKNPIKQDISFLSFNRFQNA